MMRRAALLLLGTATIACNSSNSEDDSFNYVWANYMAGDVSANVCLGGTACANHLGVSLQEGSVAVEYVEFVSHADKPLSGGTLAVDNSSVMQVLPSSTDPSQYAFLGVRAGQTTLRVSYNGHVIESVPAIVTAPLGSGIPPTLDGGPPVVAQEADATADGGGPVGDGALRDVQDEDGALVGMASDATEGASPDSALSDQGAPDVVTIDAVGPVEPPPEASVIDAGGA